MSVAVESQDDFEKTGIRGLAQNDVEQRIESNAHARLRSHIFKGSR
jgi:hypothetical protein